MRLDKFLKVSRIIKRRTLSKEISQSERVKVNGKVAKPWRFDWNWVWKNDING